MVLDKARSEMSMKVDVDPNDPSPESLIVAEDGGGEQKLLKDSQKNPPRQAAASKRTFHHKNDLKYISTFLKNNKSNIIAFSEKQGLHSNHNINNNSNNNCQYSHADKKDCRPSAEECCDDHKYNINSGLGRSNPSQYYYQGRRQRKPPCSPRKLHGDARPQHLRRGAAMAGCTALQENHATAPKFGEWNYLKKAMEYSDIFDKLQQEKKAELSARASSPARNPSQAGSTTKGHHKNSSLSISSSLQLLSFMWSPDLAFYQMRGSSVAGKVSAPSPREHHKVCLSRGISAR